MRVGRPALFLSFLLATLLLAPGVRGNALPDGFTMPAGFTIHDGPSKAYDFLHQPIGYPKKGGGPDEHIEPRAVRGRCS